MTTSPALLKIMSAFMAKFNRTAMGKEELRTHFMEFLSNRTNMTDFPWMPEAEEDCCNGCNGLIKDISDVYRDYHGYLSLVVCVFGTFANLLNIVVLTRKDMSCFPVNRILAGLAVADMFVMVEYIPFSFYYSIILPKKREYPYQYAVYILFHGNFSQVLHTISMCLTLTLAIWRYIAIRYPEKSQTLCTNYRCTVSICVSYILPMFLCCPSYLLTEIATSVVEENGKNYTLYHVHLSKFAKNNQTYYLFCLWTYSVIIKWLPCLILTIISYWLIRTLCQAAKRKQVLRGYNTCPTEMADRRAFKTERRTERTTRMLVAVLLLFLLTEAPQAILVLMSAVRGTEFFLKCYHVNGEFMDILALINGAINFILYCCMSRQFRQTFGQLFKPKILANWPPQSQTELQSTYV